MYEDVAEGREPLSHDTVVAGGPGDEQPGSGVQLNKGEERKWRGVVLSNNDGIQGSQ